jgi:hypothetical protein
METESVWDDGLHIDGRFHTTESINSEEVLYSDTLFHAQCDDPPHGRLPVEEIALRWKDGSITRIQAERPPPGVVLRDSGGASRTTGVRPLQRGVRLGAIMTPAHD